MKSENNKLTNMLTIVTGNYNNLKHMVSDEELFKTRKRKASDDGDLIRNISYNRNICSEDQWSPALAKVVTESNVSTVYVRINPSDTSLVSYEIQYFVDFSEKLRYNENKMRAQNF